MYRLYREQQLNCTIEEAWEFFSSPHNLSEITPESMNFVVLSEVRDQPIFKRNGDRLHRLSLIGNSTEVEDRHQSGRRV